MLCCEWPVLYMVLLKQIIWSIFKNSFIRFLRTQLINITIWYRISHFRGGGLQDPTQTSEVKKSSCSIFPLILRIAPQ